MGQSSVFNKLKNYQLRPLQGLLELNYQNSSICELLSYAEKEINPIPEGRARSLLLFFYLINLFKNKGLNFYVKGGVILQYYLKENARATNDLDIIIPGDSDIFYEEVKKILSSEQGELTFEVKHYSKSPASDIYYYDSFSMDIVIYHNQEKLESIVFEGIYGDIFNKIKPETYKGPEVIAKDFHYLGVPLEYIFAEKILAITSELARPYKHLVDAYSLLNIDINIKLLKECLDIILEKENKTRKELGKDITKYVYQIPKDKEFKGSYIFTALQAGYNLDEDTLKEAINAWLGENL